MPFGKVLVMKSGKVVLRIPSSESGYIDLLLSKGIAPNFYQELVSAHHVKNEMHFLGQVNHKVIATPDLD